MNKSILAVVLCGASSGALAFDDFEGKYVNGAVTIEWRAGGRLGNEFVSSLCPDKKFRPRARPSHSHTGKDYAIKSDFEFSRLDVTGANKCLPKGTYQRVP
ncbi:hypothetical protein QTH97_33250 [Variovorax sp. J22R24]|uniref:hypothetical protein n=1 Tax=Variovorax gracilis TaxID=3053502 RepID=UPI002574E0D6|nr:hypothetical protein [Variovorax sp. J22R24]MDM0109825.1 hypothetical protein [Variovorax sp. J22R24]